MDILSVITDDIFEQSAPVVQEIISNDNIEIIIIILIEIVMQLHILLAFSGMIVITHVIYNIIKRFYY